MKNARLVHVAAVAGVVIPLALFLLRGWEFLWKEVPLFDGTLSDVERAIVLESHDQFQTHAEDEYATFEDLFFAQNPNFVETVENSLRDEACDIVLVTASAGYGKSGLVTEAVEKHFGVSESTIEISKFCKERSCARMEDLSLLQQTVNTLPTLDESDVDEVIRRVKGLPGRVIQIDGLDELHTTSIKLLLDSIKKVREDLNGREVLLFSRPEVVDELSADNEDMALAGILTTSLEPHRIVSSNVGLRVKNYLDYLASNEIKGGADHGGDVFSGINDEATVERVTLAVRDRIERSPYLADMLRLAVLSKLIVEEAIDPARYGLGEQDVDVRRGVLKKVMDRNANSHNRPGSDTRTTYLSALAAVAAAAKPNAKGYFSVPVMVEAVRPDDSDRTFSVSPRDVLRRSGMVSVQPERGHGKMRFEPIWLQAALAEQSGVMRRHPVLWKWFTLAFCIGVVGYLLALLYGNMKVGAKEPG